MQVQNKIKRWPCDPLSIRRRTASGADGVKLVTGHDGVGNQALHGNGTTGIAPAVKLRHIQKIGTWNVRGLLQPGKRDILEKEITRCKLSICGLSETHRKGNGHFQTETHAVYFSGNDEHSRNGVAFVLSKSLSTCVMGYEPVSDRVLSIKLKAKPVNLNIIQVYAPTSAATDADLESFYTELETVMTKIPKRELLVIMGDLNAKIGAHADKLSSCAGKFGLGQRNDRGERLIQFAAEHNLVISNTFFQNHPRRLYTWISPDGKYRNQIDYIMFGSRWKTSVKNVHTLPGADCGSDHQLLVTKIQLKLRVARKIENQRRIQPIDKTKFVTSIEQNWSQWNNINTQSTTPNQMWNQAKKLFENAVTASKPSVSICKRQHWMTDETLALVEERRTMKALAADTKRLNEISARIQEAYRRDRHAHLQNLCVELETHANKHETRDLHQKVRSITKTLTSKTWAIENSQGELLT